MDTGKRGREWGTHLQARACRWPQEPGPTHGAVLPESVRQEPTLPGVWTSGQLPVVLSHGCAGTCHGSTRKQTLSMTGSERIL